MPKLSVDVLTQVVVKSLEDVAFLFAAPMEQSAIWEEPLLLVELVFRGPESGRIAMVAPVAVGVEMTENMLGEDMAPEHVEAKIDDAVGEFVNIMSGMLFEVWVGKEEACSVERAKVKRLHAAEVDDFAKEAFAAVSLLVDDERRIDVAVFTDS